jgi:F-type H+-transporting ATPase subunit b
MKMLEQASRKAVRKVLKSHHRSRRPVDATRARCDNLHLYLALEAAPVCQTRAGIIANSQECDRSAFPTMELLHQLGELFLQAVPTIIIVLLFYGFLRWVFFQPIEKVMTERSARIEGALSEAASVEATAKQELDSYNDTLRKARLEIYAEQEAARQAVLEERARLLRVMRSRSQEDVDTAKKSIAAELAAARAEVERQTPALAEDIARLVLERPSPSRGGAAQ